MSLNSLIKKIIKEETEEWVDVSPEEYKELLDYVNGDGSIIKRLPDYAGKKIRITGELDLRGKEHDDEKLDKELESIFQNSFTFTKTTFDDFFGLFDTIDAGDFLHDDWEIVDG